MEGGREGGREREREKEGGEGEREGGRRKGGREEREGNTHDLWTLSFFTIIRFYCYYF